MFEVCAYVFSGKAYARSARALPKAVWSSVISSGGYLRRSRPFTYPSKACRHVFVEFNMRLCHLPAQEHTHSMNKTARDTHTAWNSIWPFDTSQQIPYSLELQSSTLKVRSQRQLRTCSKVRWRKNRIRATRLTDVARAIISDCGSFHLPSCRRYNIASAFGGRLFANQPDANELITFSRLHSYDASFCDPCHIQQSIHFTPFLLTKEKDLSLVCIHRSQIAVHSGIKRVSSDCMQDWLGGMDAESIHAALGKPCFAAAMCQADQISNQAPASGKRFLTSKKGNAGRKHHRPRSVVK